MNIVGQHDVKCYTRAHTHTHTLPHMLYERMRNCTGWVSSELAVGGSVAVAEGGRSHETRPRSVPFFCTAAIVRTQACSRAHPRRHACSVLTLARRFLSASPLTPYAGSLSERPVNYDML